MNRRNLLKSSLLAGLAAALPIGYSNATKANRPERKQYGLKTNNGFKKLKLGDLDISILTDGHILQKPIQPFMCPLAPKDALDQLLKDNFRSLDSVDLAMNVMLIQKGNKKILLDAGMGIFADSDANDWLLKSLSEAGIQPSEITEILISHAHPDHIGGLVDKQQNLTFPNADIYISKTEFDFWNRATFQDFSKSPLSKQPDFLKPVIDGIKQVLKTIQPKVKFYPEKDLLFGIFSFTPIPGHTPGMTMITIHSNSEKLAYIADLIHHDILLFAHPDWGFSGDTDLELATKTRKKTLELLSASKTKIFAYHLPWPGLGFAAKEANAYKWIPEVFATA